jgi:hypothetical protein
MIRAVLAFASIALAAPLAHADGGIILESYTGAKPADASRLVAPILEELALHKYQSGDTVAHRFDAVARPAITTGLPADFAAQVERGYKAWIAGKFDQTVSILAPLVEAAHANPGAFADDTAARDAMPRALIALALAHQRSGDPGAAKATLAELVRAFPDATVTRANYGPEAAQLFTQVQHDVGATGKGKLAITAGDPNAQIFVDEHAVAAGTTAIDVAPGEYRVFAKLGKRLSRSHRVVVRANDIATVTIDAGLDVSMHTGSYVGLEIGTAAEREAHEGPYAVTVAKAIGADSVIVVGVDQVRGRTSVVASLVSMQTGRDIRRASVAVDPDPSNERLRALARFVAGEEPDPNIEVLLPARGTPTAASAAKTSADGTMITSDKPAPAPVPAPVVASEGPHTWGGWKYVATGAAVAGLGIGGYLISVDGKCSVTEPAGHPCTELRSTAVPGYVSLSAGAAAAAVAIYLFVHGSGSAATEPNRTVYVVPTAGGAFAGISTRF